MGEFMTIRLRQFGLGAAACLGISLLGFAPLASAQDFFDSVADPEGQGRFSEWFGGFDDRHFSRSERRGWIDHAEHGAVYVRGGNFEAGFWYFDSILDEWLWTDAEGYPFVFSDRREAWLFYRRGGSPESREFFDYSEGEDGAWITVPPEEEEGDSER